MVPTLFLLCAAGLPGVLWCYRRYRNRQPGHALSPLSAPTAAAAAADAVLDISVCDADVLSEVDVYLQFGYLAQAAERLQHYLQQYPDADRERARLLDVYLRLQAIDAFAQVLQQLASRGRLTEAELAEAVVDGLRLDPDCLALRVLAEQTLGWDVATVSQRLGLPRPEVAVPPPLVAAAVTSGLLCQHGPLPTPAALSAHEQCALSCLLPARRSAPLLAQWAVPQQAVRVLESALLRSPRPLTPLLDLLHLHYRQRDLPAFMRQLWHCFMLLGPHGVALRQGLLRLGFALGPHPLLEQLAAARDRASLQALGWAQGWGGSPPAPASLPLLTATALPVAAAAPPDALAEADAYLDYGQYQQAQAVLEQAILAAPQDERLYPPLLELYEKLEAAPALCALLASLRRQSVAPPPALLPRLSRLRQRWQLDDLLDLPLENDDVCQHAG